MIETNSSATLAFFDFGLAIFLREALSTTLDLNLASNSGLNSVTGNLAGKTSLEVL
jgi:hypothetical protein